MIQISNLSKNYGPQEIFDSTGFHIERSQKIGLVGRNGSGKSTLLKIIYGEESIEDGEIQVPRNYTIGRLEQHIKFKEKTLLEECTHSLKVQDYEAKKILFGLGFNEEDLSRDPHQFSGGQQVRIQLVKVLLINPNLLLLDEPTNYLDILGLRWLKDFLINYPGEFILITHDAEFMNAVTSHIVGIYRNKIRKIKGSVEDYRNMLIEEEVIHERTRKNEDRKRKDMEDFVNKFRAKARQASLAQSRLKMLNKMDSLDKHSSEKDLNFKFPYAPIPSKVLIKCEDLSFGYKKEDPLFKGVKFEVSKGDVLGIIGKNGRGKSTLLNVMGGELTPWTGSIQLAPNMAIGHFGQTNIDRLHQENTIIDEIHEMNPEMPISQVRAICGAMLFSGDTAKKTISVLSGGERARVMLGKILASTTNILLLDEPTHHLDQESVEVLTEQIKAFPGAVMLVTHSETILKKLTNKLVVFDHGGASYFDEGYHYFLEKIGFSAEDRKEKTKKNPNRDKKEIKKLRNILLQEKSALLNPLKKEFTRLEKKIEELETLESELQSKLSSTTGEEVQQLSIKWHKAKSELETAIENWENTGEEIEGIESEFKDRLECL